HAERHGLERVVEARVLYRPLVGVDRGTPRAGATGVPPVAHGLLAVPDDQGAGSAEMDVDDSRKAPRPAGARGASPKDERWQYHRIRKPSPRGWTKSLGAARGRRTACLRSRSYWRSFR